MHAYAGHGNTSRSYSGFDQHDLLRLIKRELINLMHRVTGEGTERADTP